MYDLVLQNVRIVDPVNNVDKQGHIAIENGRVADICEESLAARCDTLLDMDGYVALPGIIDIHTHVTAIFGGSCGGYRMLARAGVCTTLDLAGPATEAFSLLGKYGAGITVGVLESIRPEVNVPSADPSAQELNNAVCTALEDGAIGCKLLGGHFPLTPEASACFVEEAHREQAYASWHAGTTKSVNLFESFREMIELTNGHALHAAHINSYCRGVTGDAVKEAQEAMELLKQNPNLYSESYIAETNGTSFIVTEKGDMYSKATGRTLETAGYTDSRDGLAQAVLDGFGHVFAPYGVETGVYRGEEGARMVQDGTAISGGFNVNPALSRLLLCLGKKADGSFVVDALATDGGGLPRNILVPYGMSLVKMGMLSLAEFVTKTSTMPAKMMGLANKGHLGVGADADLTIVDTRTCEPVATIVGGKVVMFKGHVTGTGGHILTTERGKASISSFGMPYTILDPTTFLPKR